MKTSILQLPDIQDEWFYQNTVVDNRKEPPIRKGDEAFWNAYEIDDGYNCVHIIDPKRSLAAPMLSFQEWGGGTPEWAFCDCLSVLIGDVDIDRWHPTRGDLIAFWTIFPDGVAQALARCYMKDCSWLAKHAATVRVLNNPWFHKDRNANERRLVEIAEDNGLRFALDRIDPIPPPDVLAREIALLNHGLRDPENVEPVRARLAASIAGTMADWGLSPTA